MPRVANEPLEARGTRSSAPPALRPGSPSGLLRKCFELAGIVPLGVFVPVHLASYAGALFGGTEFGVPAPDSLVVLGLEALLIWLPLLFHGGYGAWLSLGALTEPEASERLHSILMRVTGMLTLILVPAHAAWLRLPLFRGERGVEDVGEILIARLSATVQGVPIAAALHLVGLGVVLSHLALGVPRFVEKWGLGSVRLTRKVAALGCGALFVLGAGIVIEFATGSVVPRFFVARP